jgi:hypothetical protein
MPKVNKPQTGQEAAPLPPALSIQDSKTIEGQRQNVSAGTIQKVCKVRLFLPSRCIAKKPLLMAKMVKKRLNFCKKHRSWSETDWETVMFSDERMFRLINPKAHRQHHGVGLLEWRGWQRFSLLFVAQSNNEQRLLQCHAEGQTSLLDEAPQGEAFPLRWGTLAYQQEGYSLPQREQGLCYGLDGELT